MSRREGRDSDSKHRRSRFDREASPKRSRWDDKPATERPSKNISLESGDHKDQGQKHPRQLQSAFSFENHATSGLKPEVKALSKASDEKTSGQQEGNKLSYNPTDVPRSRAYFQHDERGNAGQVGRSFSRKAEAERGWDKGSRDQPSERAAYRTSYDIQKRNEKSQPYRDDNQSWHHDRYNKLETDAKLPPARKRPSFKEIKEPVDTEKAAEPPAVDPMKQSNADHHVIGNERRDERGSQNSHHSNRVEKWSRDASRMAPQRGNLSSRDKYDGGHNSRGRERFAAPRGYQQRVTAHDKEWKHDLFEEANRSPTPKNEEDQIAKIEALLAS